MEDVQTNSTANKKNIILVVLAVAIVAVIIIIALKARVTPPNQGPIPTPGVVADSQLTLHLTQLDLPGNGATQPSKVNVELTAGSHPVTCVQFTLSYDPSALTNVTITPGTMFTNPNVLPSPSGANGTLPYAICTSLGGQPVTGKGTVAVVSFSINPTAKGSTTMAFVGKSIVTGQNIKTSILKSTQNAVIPLSR